MIRKTRKIRKYRGSRTCGGGSHKKRRGFGSKGGKGLAGGRTKAKWDWIQMNLPGHLGKRGFVLPPEARKDTRTVNIGYLSENATRLLARKLASEKDGRIMIDAGKLGVDKVLGAGKVRQALIVQAQSFSEKAKQKIVGAGGEARAAT